MFWIFAAIALFLGALVTLMPLFRDASGWKPLAVALLFLLPASGLWLYQQVGSPAGIGVEPTPHMAVESAADMEEVDELVSNLRARLDETPASLDGWILLARTLKTMQRFPEAVEALETALRIDPENPAAMVELAEARVFTSPDGQIDETSIMMLERALELQPEQQKALWLLGVAAAQANDLALAIGYWESLLELLEPGSPVAQSIQGQIREAQSRMGMTVDAPAPETAAEAPPAIAAAVETAPPTEQPASDAGGWQGTSVRVSLSEEAAAVVPEGAVLFVIIRPAGMAVGPPIGVRRVIGPELPLDLTISDGDSMLAERKISLESEISLQARISLSGSPAARSGDWQSAAQTVPLASGDAVELRIDQRVE